MAAETTVHNVDSILIESHKKDNDIGKYDVTNIIIKNKEDVLHKVSIFGSCVEPISIIFKNEDYK